LKKCGSRGRGKVSMNTKGAGLGIYETVKALNSLIVNVERGKSSEVIGLIKLNPSVAELRKRRCSLHFFQR